MREELMKAGAFGRLRATFDAAVELPAGEVRRKFLEEACAGDTSTLASIERLLAQDAAVAASGTASLPRFGPYQATRQLGRGGMGLVYEAHRDDGEFERRVAIKVLLTGTLSTDARDGLRAERQVLAGLVHPGIGQLFDGGITHNGDPYLVVEFIDGEHLDAYCNRRQLPAKERLSLMAPILDAVEYAHSAGVIHLDLKPSNILVTPAGHTKLIDFGLARSLGADPDRLRQRGTPEYAAPEMTSGRPVDERTDIYALAVIYAKVLGDAAKTTIVQRATSIHPAERYASIAEFRHAILHEPASAAKGRWAAAALAIGFTLLAAGGFWLMRTPRPAALKLINPPETSWRGAALSWHGDWWTYSDGDSSPDHNDIWVSRTGAYSPERLFTDTHRDEDPTISPEGRFVAFRSNRQPAGIFEFDRQTRHLRSLVPGGHQPKYSPDGRWLMYAISDDRDDPLRTHENQWFVMPVRGGPVQAISEGLRVSEAIWANDSQSIWLQARKPPALFFNSIWRKRLDAGPATLAVHWPNNLSLCAESPAGQALLGLRYPEHALMQVPLRAAPGADTPSVAESASLTEVPPLLSGCAVDRTGRTYVRNFEWQVKNYNLPTTKASSSPQELASQERGFIGASWDGLTTIQKSGDGIKFSGPFGDRDLAGAGAVSGDGLIMWNSHDNSPYQATALDVRQQFRVLGEHVGIRSIWGASADGSFALAYDGSAPRPITALSLGSEARARILKHPKWNLYRARLSRGDKWVAFTAHDPSRGLRVFVAPFRGLNRVPVEEWRDLAEGTSPVFSPGGDRLYFASKRDGHWCIYALPLDPLTMRATGEAVALAHLHGQYSAGEMPGSTFSIFCSEDGLRFSLGRQRHNVWEYSAGAP